MHAASSAAPVPEGSLPSSITHQRERVERSAANVSSTELDATRRTGANARKSISATRRWALASPEDRREINAKARRTRWEGYKDRVRAAVPGLSEAEVEARARALLSADMRELAHRPRKRKTPTVSLTVDEAIDAVGGEQ